MYSKEQFNWVWKNTSRKGILNQFYYDHLEMEKYKNIINELEKYYDENIKNCINGMNMLNSNSNEAKRLTTRFVVYNESLGKLKELKEGKNNE